MPGLVPSETLDSTCAGIIDRALERGVALLDKTASGIIIDFIRSRKNQDGGFSGRSERSDLYYTYFAWQTLKAFNAAEDSRMIIGFLRGLRPDEFDEIANLACVAGIQSKLDKDVSIKLSLSNDLMAFRKSDGGFCERKGGESTAYGCFLASLVCEYVKIPAPNSDAMINYLKAVNPSATPAIAAKSMLLACYGNSNSGTLSELAERYCDGGGFRALPLSPVPDLLSTATALCAMNSCGYGLDARSGNECRCFIEDLWRDCGGFAGHRQDMDADVEYTCYALISLGLLA